MNSKRIYASFDEVVELIPDIIELKINYDKLDGENDLLDICDSKNIVEYIKRQYSKEKIALKNYMMSLKLSELLSVQAIMYIGRNIIDQRTMRDFENPDEAIHNMANTITKSSESENIIKNMIGKVPMAKYLEKGMEYLLSL